MTSINELERVYSKFFKDAFEKLKLIRYETYDSKNGSWIKFKNDSFRVQLIDDRLIETDLSRLFGSEQFIGIESFNAVIRLNSAPSNLNESEKRKIIGQRLDYLSQAEFLIKSYNEIKRMLTQDNYEKTLNDINSLGHNVYPNI